MAVEDGWVLAQHVRAGRPRRTGHSSGVDWAAALAAYEAVRTEHCRRVVLAAREWGRLWHLEGIKRMQRNVLLRSRDPQDYAFTDWLYGPTALTPGQLPNPFPAVALDSVQAPVP